MDKINFANPQSPYQELQLARWYTASCALICLMIICMCSIYFIQWRAYQHATRHRKSYAAYHALIQEHAQLQAQHQEQNKLKSAQKITSQKLIDLNEGLGKDIQLTECIITRDGNHNLTLTAPTRQRAQECVAALSKKQLFGALSITSLKAIPSGDKKHLVVIIQGKPAQNS
jgi:hypothetical protein